MRTIGEAIKAARKAKGFTQRQLADLMEIPYQGISQWERGARTPKHTTLKKIAVALGVNWKDLVPDD